MRESRDPHMPPDLLDHLVLDICELEVLAERLIQSLNAANLEAIPRGPTAVQLLDLLSRMEETSGTLHRAVHARIKSVVVALASDPHPVRRQSKQHRDRVLVGAVNAPKP